MKPAVVASAPQRRSWCLPPRSKVLLCEDQAPAAPAVCLLLAAVGLTAAIAQGAAAADWPTYGHDPARSHATAERLAFPLQPAWTWQSADPPRPAWGDPKTDPVEEIQELRRIHFDDVFQPVVADGALYFGSSADCHVYCVDAATCRLRWRFLTGGPVRLAPAVAGDRVYFGSDDGYAYCLRAAAGSLAGNVAPRPRTAAWRATAG